MSTDPADKVDPSEVDAPLRSPDPRSGWWSRMPMMPRPGGGFDEAKAFHAERGYWPPGTPMRRDEDDKLDRYGDPEDRAVFAEADDWSLSETAFMTKVFRQELLHCRIAADSLISRSIARRDGMRFVAEQAAYQFSAYVLREDLPPVTAKGSRTVEVSILQVSPATWVDHWKLTYRYRWWCRWLVRRYPARTVDRPQSRHVKINAEFDLDRHRLYPRAPRSSVRAFGEPVTVAVIRPININSFRKGPRG